MIDRSGLLKDLQRELPKIEKDILAYSESKPELAEHLQEEYEKAQVAGRTAEHIVAWREAQITQAAVAWILTCVFVRFLEDNNLLMEPMLSGPAKNEKGDKPLEHAKERMVAYFNENPTLEERDYLLNLFSELERFPVIAELLDHRHNPLWQIPVSSDGAKALIDFFQKIDADSGEIIHDFTDANWDTRFLGDLYQDLSEAVRKRYALLQTPEFVESFILDYTLEKAKDTFGLPGLRLIDPTCGSGHFLLTTFERMFDTWQKREPGTNVRELAQRALDVVHGVDINPYAIAICRFRLFIAAMKAAGSRKVKSAPNFHFNLACGDSLLHGRRFEWLGQGRQTDLIDEDPIKHVLEVEDKDKLSKILGQQYHAVVGNPPYIVVRDKALKQAYRERYSTCFRQYSLGVPFTERFFDLTVSSARGQSSGFMGMITANSFMTREFGKNLIEKFLPTRELTHIIDTSGAYIPGHGIPTVILFARNNISVKAPVRSVLGIRGEPTTPTHASQGKVWRSIMDLIDHPNSENEFISVVDHERAKFSSHPWSVTGGGAAELKDKLDMESTICLGSLITSIGRYCHTGNDEAYFFPKGRLAYKGFSSGQYVQLVEGSTVRDWGIRPETEAIFPYGEGLTAIKECPNNIIIRHLWGVRSILSLRKEPGGTHEEIGLTWYEWSRWHPERYSVPLGIAFAEVATHNHFSLNRGGNVFKQTSPVIKFPKDKSENYYYSVLGLLNSSIVCFWMKEVCHNKGDFKDSSGARVTGDPAFDTYQYSSTALKKLPIAAVNNSSVLKLAKQLDNLSVAIDGFSPEKILSSTPDDLVYQLDISRDKINDLFSQQIFCQEELDWLCYDLYKVSDDIGLKYSCEDVLLRPGERAFEIYLARKIRDGKSSSSWFERHKFLPVVDIPSHWPKEYQKVVELRIYTIEKNRNIYLTEQPEYKRRWSKKSLNVSEKKALKSWLLNRIEELLKSNSCLLRTGAQLVDLLLSEPISRTIFDYFSGSKMCDAQSVLIELLEPESVPQYSRARLKPTALKKYFAWQETWDKQRQEDEIDVEFGVDQPLSEEDATNEEKIADYKIGKVKAAAKKAEVVGDIPLPPKYAIGDFRKASYWSLRGKLDLAKERFFSLPGCEKDGDSTLVIGWAGMNHLQRATAIATWYLDRKETDGWEAEKLKPMLVAIDELIPWLKQWHNEIDPEFGERMGDYYEGFLLEEMRMLDITKDDLLAWEPVTAPKKKAALKKRVAKRVTELNNIDAEKEQG